MMFQLNSLRKIYTILKILLLELLFGEHSLIWLEMVSYLLKNILISLSMPFPMKLQMTLFQHNSNILLELIQAILLNNISCLWDNVFSTSYLNIFYLSLLKTKTELLQSEINLIVLQDLMNILLSSFLGIRELIKIFKKLN